MFGQRKKLILNKKDLKQAVLEKNKSIEKSNKKLANEILLKKDEIKDYNKSIKLLDKSFDNKKSNLDTLSKKEDSMLLSIEKSSDKLKKLNISLDDAKSSISLIAAEKIEIEDYLKKLNKDVSDSKLLHDKTSKYIEKNKSVQSDLYKANAKLRDFNNKIEEAEANYASLDISLDMKKGDHEEELSNLSFEKDKYLDQHKDVKSKYDSLLKEYNAKNEELEASIEYSNSQVKGLNCLVEEKQNTCIALDNQIANKEDDIKRAEFKAEKIELEAKEKVKDIKKNYQAWKTNMLAEVAKIQLKGKVENIDKAGLSEILNG